MAWLCHRLANGDDDDDDGATDAAAGFKHVRIKTRNQLSKQTYSTKVDV